MPFAEPGRKVLLTSVCRPLGERYGDGPSVGYELLFGQVTRAQGLFSPRANHIHFSLEFIAENLEAPVTVLQYPSRAELIRELGKGYAYVGISFLLATFHRMKEVVALVRRYAPGARLVLGGYGTVLGDEVLGPFADHVCREEGVGFFRRLLGEPEIAMPYGHPLVVSRMRIFGREASRTGMVFAGLGCPNGCDFCCTSHFFKRRHIRLLPAGRDVYRVIERYLEIDPEMSIVVLDEDFLLNRKRAMEFRECVQKDGRPLSIFAFASVRALSQYTVREVLEMGIDGLWIGYEGTRSGYAKQQGRPIGEIFTEFRRHGIGILASMIVGLPYQTPEIIREELDGLLALEPDLGQFLIYGPSPGTPFFERVMKEGLLHERLRSDPETYYRESTGFGAMVRHPSMAPRDIETIQRRCFREDFERLGPSIYRALETWLHGYQALREAPSPFLRRKAERLAREIRRGYPIFLAGRLFGPSTTARRKVAALERRVHQALGRPTWVERLQAAAAVGAAAWTGATLKLGLFQHPKLVRHTFRMPEEAPPASVWLRLRRLRVPVPDALEPREGLGVEVELRPESTVWVHVAGRLAVAEAQRLAEELREALRRTEDRLILDLRRLLPNDLQGAKRLVEELRAHCDRIRIALPRTGEFAALAGVLAVYR
jgi:haloalkane dehalogenase